MGEHKLVMRVLLEYAGPPMKTHDLVLPATFGGATNPGKGVSNLRNEYRAGRVHISFDLAKDWVALSERDPLLPRR